MGLEGAIDYLGMQWF